MNYDVLKKVLCQTEVRIILASGTFAGWLYILNVNFSFAGLLDPAWYFWEVLDCVTVCLSTMLVVSVDALEFGRISKVCLVCVIGMMWAYKVVLRRCLDTVWGEADDCFGLLNLESTAVREIYINLMIQVLLYLMKSFLCYSLTDDPFFALHPRFVTAERAQQHVEEMEDDAGAGEVEEEPPQTQTRTPRVSNYFRAWPMRQEDRWARERQQQEASNNEHVGTQAVPGLCT